MKKIRLFSMIMASLSIIFLSSCGEKTQQTEPTNSEKTPITYEKRYCLIKTDSIKKDH